MLARVLVKGGAIAIGSFQKILEIAKRAGNSSVCIGSRQDVIFHMYNADGIDATDLSGGLEVVAVDNVSAQVSQNVVSSIVSCDIEPSLPWLHEGSYLQIIESLAPKHSLKINITDPSQSLVPLMSGELNFVASHHEKYWYLFIRFPHEDEVREWPALVHSNDMSAIATMIETIYARDKHIHITPLFAAVNAEVLPNNRMKDRPFVSPTFVSPKYEGINSMITSNQYWAGFYWRNNEYDIAFLEKIVGLCARTGNTRIFFTPWKSILVKDIKADDIRKWEIAIGKHGITMRHAAVDLNWHLPLLDHKAFSLKTWLVREMDKRDIRTEGVTISIQDKSMNPFTTIIIEPMSLGLFGIGSTYRVSYATGFNPSGCSYVVFDEGVRKSGLVDTIAYLCEKFYEEMPDELSVEPPVSIVHDPVEDNHYVYQCQSCLTVYDAAIGSERNHISEGVDFDALPGSFVCETCDAPRSNFAFVMSSELR